LITGIPGQSLQPEAAHFIQSAQIGGIILFSANYADAQQITQFIDEIQDLSPAMPHWICVDQEGGKVQRFKKDFSIIPEAAEIAAKDSPKTTYDLSQIMARELKKVGVNINFAPVADINTNPNNPVIGRRAFGDTEEQVSKHVTSFVRGHLQEGILPCVKHFPGHGDTTTDSHFALPKVSDTLETLRAREFRPFLKAFKSGCPLVMTAHVQNDHLDKEFPATLSRKTMTDILRQELRFDGLIISDDLEMKAITDHYGAETAPRLAISAGCDLLIYRTMKAAQLAHGFLTQDLESGKLSPEQVIESFERSRHYKREFLISELNPS
jgi:beta-N-acetylhexosaminidase